MSSIIPQYTPYPYVNEAVQCLLENVRNALGSLFVGLYLHGSLASGDFDPGHSDIDFLVVTTEELPQEIIPELETMHHHIWASDLDWTKKLEGTYIPLKSLKRYDSGDPPRPGVNEQRFFTFPPEPPWIINRYVLRENCVVVFGPPIRPLITPISPQEIRNAVASILIDYWKSIENDTSWVTPYGHQPYVVLTCCRALYTLKHGKVKSKPVSASWALKTLDKEWHGLIKNAMIWRYGTPQGNIEQTMELIRYTIRQAIIYRD